MERRSWIVSLLAAPLAFLLGRSSREDEPAGLPITPVMDKTPQPQREIYRLGKEGLERILWKEQGYMDSVLVVDKDEHDRITDLHAHYMLGFAKPQPDMPPNADPIHYEELPLDALAASLDTRMGRNWHRCHSPGRNISVPFSVGRISREAYLMRIGEETLDIDDLRSYFGHTQVLNAVSKLIPGPTAQECLFLASMYAGFPESCQRALIAGLYRMSEAVEVPMQIEAGQEVSFCLNYTGKSRKDDYILVRDLYTHYWKCIITQHQDQAASCYDNCLAKVLRRELFFDNAEKEKAGAVV